MIGVDHILAPWADAGVFSAAEVAGAPRLVAGSGSDDPGDAHLVLLGAAFALWAPLHGHTCIDLDQVRTMVRAEIATGDAEHESIERPLPWPEPNAWRTALAASRVCRVVIGEGRDGAATVLDDRPLVLAASRIYTQRQWADEQLVAAELRARRIVAAPLADDDAQRAALAAIERAPLAVIVGGPGSGKTYTIARAIAHELARTDGSLLRVALVAPTGKAAGRLREAIASAAADIAATSPAVAAELTALDTSTVHRLLGPIGSRTRFRHTAANPLPYDLVIVDEASMVALPLMARLLEALRADARLVLVGDPDQLRSVEVGSVLADIVAAAAVDGSPLADNVVRLAGSHRQQRGSPIHPLAEAIRTARADDAIALLRKGFVDPSTGEALLTFVEHDDPIGAPDGAGIRDIVVPPWSAARRDAVEGNARAALERFASVRVLCAHRLGRHGVRDWNWRIEAWLAGDTQIGTSPRFYPGRPLLATRNDLRLGIANGDTGIVVNGPDGLRAAFATGDGVTSIAPAQLEAVETAYAMTIHKSQGSEYATVVVVLPPADSPLTARELLYTAVTRTTERLVVVGTADSVRASIDTPTRRTSGLVAALSTADAG